MRTNKMYKRVTFLCEDYTLGGDVIGRAVQEVQVLDEKGRIVRRFKVEEYTDIDPDELSCAVFEEMPEFRVDLQGTMKYRGVNIVPSVGFTSIKLGFYYGVENFKERADWLLQALERWIEVIESFQVVKTTVGIEVGTTK